MGPKGLPTWYRNDFYLGTSSFSLHIFLCILLPWYRNEISFPYKSWWFSFRMKFSFWYEILFWYHVNWKWTSFWIENCKSCCLGRVAHKYLIWNEAVRFYHVNAVRTSLWYETHSGMKVIPVSYKQPLSFILSEIFEFGFSIQWCFA